MVGSKTAPNCTVHDARSTLTELSPHIEGLQYPHSYYAGIVRYLSEREKYSKEARWAERNNGHKHFGAAIGFSATQAHSLIALGIDKTSVFQKRLFVKSHLESTSAFPRYP
jgi:hypothetical protein